MQEHKCSRKGWAVAQCEMCSRAIHYKSSWTASGYVPRVCSEECAWRKEKGEPMFPRVESLVYDSCEECGVCLFAGYSEPKRDESLSLCGICLSRAEIAASITKEEKREQLSARIRTNNINSGRLVAINCFVCGREVTKRKSEVEKLDFHYCDPTCGKTARAVKLSRKLVKYTPDFLRSLMEQDLVSCHFPGCDEPKAVPSKQNQFGLCRLHAQRVYVALCARRQVRTTIFKKHGINA